jgi:hypothetical protein
MRASTAVGWIFVQHRPGISPSILRSLVSATLSCHCGHNPISRRLSTDDTAVYKKSNHFHGGNGGILSLAKVKLNPIRSVGQTEANCFGKRRPKDDRGN